jgi:hypothetical protein
MVVLKGEHVLEEIAACIEKSASVKIAAPYWGEDAIERLKLERTTSPSKHQIICNLESGACNPRPIRTLIRVLGWTVLTNARLHAKVYIFDNSAIVGSANPSSNGLTDDATRRHGWHEVCVKLTDKRSVAKLRHWFESISHPPQSRTVTSKSLRDATKRFDANQKNAHLNRIRSADESLSELLKGDQAEWWLNNLYVWIYKDSEVSNEADAYARRYNCWAYEVMSDPKRWNSSFNGTVIDCGYTVIKNGLSIKPTLSETFPHLSAKMRNGYWCLPARSLSNEFFDRKSKRLIANCVKSRPPKVPVNGVDWAISLKRLLDHDYDPAKLTIARG